MPVYMLFIREGAVRDKEALETYSRINREGPRDPNLKPLVVYGAMETLEGAAPDGVVLLQFPDEESAKAWYNSPQYQSAIAFRQKGADYRAIMVHGL